MTSGGLHGINKICFLWLSLGLAGKDYCRWLEADVLQYNLEWISLCASRSSHHGSSMGRAEVQFEFLSVVFCKVLNTNEVLGLLRGTSCFGVVVVGCSRSRQRQKETKMMCKFERPSYAIVLLQCWRRSCQTPLSHCAVCSFACPLRSQEAFLIAACTNKWSLLLLLEIGHPGSFYSFVLLSVTWQFMIFMQPVTAGLR